MKRLITFVLLLVTMTAQASMNYRLSFTPESHLLHVELSLDGLEAGETLLRMPVWAPGYYLILDSPKHVSRFHAADADGNELGWAREGKDGWRVSNGAARRMTVSYDVYANLQSVGEAKVIEEYAYLPGNEVYMYIDGRKDLGATVTVELPDAWGAACCSMKPLGALSYEARDYDELVDCPMFVGNPLIREFEVDGRPVTLCVAHPEGFDADTYQAELTRMIQACTDQMGGKVPYDRYCFLWLEVGGGGLEHASSQACMTGRGMNTPDRAGHLNWLSFVSHEYYHLYNVKSIRPFELGPFDYSRENFTDQLWISEGMTCYYEFKVLYRAGLCTAGELLKAQTGYIADTERIPGRNEMSLARSSYDIWLNFFNGDGNHDEVSISYYIKGPVVALMMDLAIRQATANRHSLDDLMCLLYDRYYEELGRGFHPEEFWAAATEIAEGNTLEDIRELVYTTAPIDYERYLGYAGMTIDRSDWSVTPAAKANSLQKAIRRGVFGE